MMFKKKLKCDIKIGQIEKYIQLMSLKKPYDLQRLELGDFIGQGGFGKVFKAKDKNNDNIYAAKISFHLINESSDEMHNLIREVNIMSKFQHPAILKLIGYSPINFDKEPFSVIISEFSQNGSLNKIIDFERSGTSISGWDATQKLICLYGISSAMDYLHSNKVIHRDLKPENILLDEFLYPKIGDFGLAKVVHQSMDSLTFQSNSCIKGTAYYIAPEIIDDNDDENNDEVDSKKDDPNWYETIYSTASDVYAFAFIVYELITLDKPYQDLNSFKIWKKVVEGGRPKIKSTTPKCYKKLIQDCWSQNPSLRPSFSQIVEEFETNKNFLTDSIDSHRFSAYVKFIKESKKSFDSKSVILDPAKFMKKEKIEIKKVQIDDEISKTKTSSKPVSKSRKIKLVMRKVKGSDSDSEPEVMKEISVAVSKRKKETPKLSSSTNDIKLKLKLFPMNEYKKLSQSCKELVVSAETNPEEQFKVARNLINGSDEFPENKELGQVYLMESLSNGYVDPDAESIRWIVEGKVVPRDLKSAKKYLTENMTKSDPKYPILLGKIMKKEGKFKEAKRVLERAASFDNGEAQYELGKMYFKGQSVEADKDEAMSLFSKSQNNGCSKSSNFLKHHKISKKTDSSKKSVKTDITVDRRKEAKKIGDVDEKAFKSLSSSFSKNPQSAIKESESFLAKPDFSSYDSFLEDVKKTLKSNCCIVSWSKEMLSARCLDCQLQDNSCICIPCFLAGKHDQHHSFILGGSGAGNCDCGDPSFWKKSGNCPHHPGPDSDPDLTQMTPINRKKFITVFKAAFYGGFNSKDDDKCARCFKWIQSFIQFGDGLRRCCSIAITSVGDDFFYSNLDELDTESTNALIDLFGQLVSDHIFSTKMGSSIMKHYLLLRKKIANLICQESYFKKSKPFRPIKKLLGFSFHFFNEKPLRVLMKSGDFDWVDFIIDSLAFVFETIEKVKADYFRLKNGNIVDEIWYLQKLIEVLLKDDSQHSKLQVFINRYSKLLAKYEASFYYSYMNKSNGDSGSNYFAIIYINLMLHVYDFNLTFTKNFEASTKNTTFSISETFNCLFNFLQSQTDFHAVSIYSSDKLVPISPILPLHHLFYCLLSSIKNPSEALSKECEKKCVDLQDFCSLCSIYPLRFISSVFIPSRFSHIDEFVYRIVKISHDSPDRLFNQFFGLYQLLLGIAEDKEKLMENAALTFALFSESSMPSLGMFEGNLLELILQGFGKSKDIDSTSSFYSAIFLISALTDRSIISFDKVSFRRLRVIELLMRSKPSAEDIESLVKDTISNPIFGDDLATYAERVKTNNGSYFKLTNECDFTPFFPLIHEDQRIKLLNKNKDKLIKIPECDELNLSYKSCFRTPLFVSLMFDCLRNKDNLAEFQVGLAMFVLAMQNGPKFDSSSYKKNKKNLNVEGENLNEIFEKLKYILDNDSVNFAIIKFKLDKERPVSILELVESNPRIGIEAIEKADLPIQIKVPEADVEELNHQKKEKAKKLKEQILKDFETRRNVFNLGGTSAIYKNDENEDEKDDEEDDLSLTASIRTSMTSSFMKSQLQCSVCQNSESANVMCFPCLSIPSIFPSLIHCKLHKLKKKIEDMECVFSLTICTHTVHYKCCSEHDKNETFQCMIDRGNRNCLLPYFPSKSGKFFEQKLSSERIEVIKKFMDDAFKLEKGDNQLLIALKSFVGSVLIIEVRHRSRPECLDNANVPFLLRNLLLTLYFYFNRIKKDAAREFEDIEDPLLKLVVNIINSKNPKIEFKKFVKEIGNKLKGDFLYEFLRRAAIIEDLALKEMLFTSGEKFIDWDEVLSVENLLERFDISSSSIKNNELPIFQTIPLADRFVSLYQKPYNLDIFDTSVAKFVDLLTGNVVFFSRTGKSKTDLPFVVDYVKDKYKNGVAMFLAITGPNASALVYLCPELEMLFTKDSFYIDQFGDNDHGLKRGAILSLSQDRLESALDKLLSGEVILY